jgi:16S rRNA (cytosine1402-N4)-methyltransferase
MQNASETGVESVNANTPQHVPVLLHEVVSLFEPALAKPNSVLVDATLGLGGHAEALLTAHPTLRLIGIDQDASALEIAAARLSKFVGRVQLHYGRFDQLNQILIATGLAGKDCVQGVFFDLGVSSMQLDQVERGFSYAHNGPLDMRMNQQFGPTAADLLATTSESEIKKWLVTFGEEKFAGPIAKAIVKARVSEPITTTSELAEIVKEVIPAPARRAGGNPSKRTFQALRIAVNDELGTLQRALPQAIDALALGGRCVVLSFQSLEDKLVKAEFAKHSQQPDLLGLPTPINVPTPRLRLLTRGAKKASSAEVAANPRAGSVRLRAAECQVAA